MKRWSFEIMKREKGRKREIWKVRGGEKLKMFEIRERKNQVTIKQFYANKTQK